jgi:tripartite-type tricarboxylate transporter receptor subunit TctC
LQYRDLSAVRGRIGRILGAGALLFGLAAPAIARADDIADFYRGKRFTILVGSGSGSGYDFGARVLANYIGKHIPGNPNVVVEDMPGGGGRDVANYIGSTAPRDGTVIAAVQSFIAVDPLFDNSKAKAQFDPRQFTWIGSIVSSSSVAVAWRNAPVQTFDDLFKHELIVGGVGGGTPMVTFPYLFDRLFGMKFKVVAGYTSGPDVDLAMERGEVQGRVDYSWHTLRLSHMDWVKEGKLNLLFQMGLRKDPELTDVPLLLDYAKTEEERDILKAAFISYDFGRAFVAPPDLPADRKAALRKAFMDTMSDKAFLDESDAKQLEVNPVPAERLESLVQEVYSLPAPLLARTKALQDPDGGQ